MKLGDINPFIRFTGQVTYTAKNRPVYVKDCRLFYILDGNGEILANGQSFELKKNVLFYCCGGTEYNIKAKTPLKIYTLNYDLTQRNNEITSILPPVKLKKGEKKLVIDPCEITDSSFLNSCFYMRNGAEFKDDIRKIIEEYAEQRSYFRESSSAVLKDILVRLHRAKDNQSETSEAIAKVIEYIRENYRENLHNSLLAKIAGYHEYYLNRIFVRQMGLSMHKYVLNLRIKEGERLLVNTEMSISEISAETGFNSVTHFSTYFKKETNMSPLEYRQNFKNNI